jgi:hypothetical protein
MEKPKKSRIFCLFYTQFFEVWQKKIQWPIILDKNIFYKKWKELLGGRFSPKSDRWAGGATSTSIQTHWSYFGIFTFCVRIFITDILTLSFGIFVEWS